MQAKRYFLFGMVFVGLVLVFAISTSDNSVTGAVSHKISCSGGMAITDGFGNYCQMSSGSCDVSCESCDISVKVVSEKQFQQRCSAGR